MNRYDDAPDSDDTPIRTKPKTVARWWHAGLAGGLVLTLATAIKFVRSVIRGGMGEAEWIEAIGFAAAIFGMGFLCGVIVWLGRGLHRRLGMVGDAIVGATVIVVFFLCCMLLFSQEMLGAKWRSGMAMLGLAVVAGIIGGVMLGRDIRKDADVAALYARAKKRRTGKRIDDGVPIRTRRSGDMPKFAWGILALLLLLPFLAIAVVAAVTFIPKLFD